MTCSVFLEEDFKIAFKKKKKLEYAFLAFQFAVCNGIAREMENAWREGDEKRV